MTLHKAFKIPPTRKHLESSNISFEESGEYSKARTWTRLLKESSPTRGVRSRPKVKSNGRDGKMDDLSVKMKTTPLLSPTTESKLLQEIWPSAKLRQNRAITVSNSLEWEENYQDLSGYCEDQQSGNWFQAQPLIQRQQDYRIGERNNSKISSLGDNNDYLSYKESTLDESTGTGDYRTAGNNIESAGMSNEESLPFGQDQFNIISDIPNDLLSLLTTTITNEQPTINDSKLLSSSDKFVADLNLDLILDDIEPGFLDSFIPNTTENNTVQFDNSISDNLWDDNCMTQNNTYTEQYEQKSLTTDEPLENLSLLINTKIDSFDLWSYMEEENRNTEIKKESIAEKEKFTPSEIIVPSEIVNTNNRRPSRKRKQSQIEIEPHVPPLKINIKTKTVSPKKRRSFKVSSEESNSYIDSDSDAPTSDYNYKELREKNNEASRKSRINKKVKETEMMKREKELEKENIVLKMRVERLENLIASLRTAVLQSALKKES